MSELGLWAGGFVQAGFEGNPDLLPDGRPPTSDERALADGWGYQVGHDRTWWRHEAREARVAFDEWLESIPESGPPRPLENWRRRPGKGDLYFMRAPSGETKIGRSIHPELRKVQIAGRLHQQVETVALVRGGGHLEPVLHKLFADERLYGEWFATSPRLEALIQQVGRGSVRDLWAAIRRVQPA